MIRTNLKCNEESKRFVGIIESFGLYSEIQGNNTIFSIPLMEDYIVSASDASRDLLVSSFTAFNTSNGETNAAPRDLFYDNFSGILTRRLLVKRIIGAYERFLLYRRQERDLFG